jgi:collagen type III alpha
MRTVFLAASMLMASLMLAPSAWAQQAEWRLVEVSGAVRLTAPGAVAVDARADMTAPRGTVVTTGANGRATLTNGTQRMVVAANSRVAIAADSTDLMTRITQDLGAILFQVDRRPQQHFRVETPLLAAVVKGTTFTVRVGPGDDRVHVAEGLVEVTPARGGDPFDVGAGITARVAQDAPGEVGVVASSAPSPASDNPLAALDYEDATHGLVANGPGANQGQASGRERARGAELGTGETAAHDGARPSAPGLATALAQAHGGNGAGPPIAPPGQDAGPPVTPPGSGGGGPPVTPPGPGGGGPPITLPGQGGGGGPPITPPGPGGGGPPSPGVGP